MPDRRTAPRKLAVRASASIVSPRRQFESPARPDGSPFYLLYPRVAMTSPATQQHAQSVRLAELLAALSLATDLAMAFHPRRPCGPACSAFESG